MKKLLIFLLSFLSVGILMAQDMKLGELLEKNYKAVGLDMSAKIQTIKSTGKMSPQGSPDLLVTSIKKLPNLAYTEMEILGTKIIAVIDGKNGWMINPFIGAFNPQDMTPEMITSSLNDQRSDPFSIWNNPFVKWEQNGNKIELVGKEDLSGTQVYNLKMTFKDSVVVDYYMDVSKFVILKKKEKKMIEGSDDPNRDKI